MEEKETWIFLFAVDYPPYKNRYVEICDTFTNARKRMLDHFGAKWVHFYGEKEGTRIVSKYNLEKLDFDDVYKGFKDDWENNSNRTKEPKWRVLGYDLKLRILFWHKRHLFFIKPEELSKDKVLMLIGSSIDAIKFKELVIYFASEMGPVDLKEHQIAMFIENMNITNCVQ